MKFYRTLVFRKLQEEWNARLEQEGFQDIEDKKGNLKKYNPRNARCRNHEEVQEFYTLLADYLHSQIDIPKQHKVVLELYLEGKPIETEIVTASSLGKTSVHMIIRHYRNLIVRGK